MLLSRSRDQWATNWGTNFNCSSGLWLWLSSGHLLLSLFQKTEWVLSHVATKICFIFNIFHKRPSAGRFAFGKTPRGLGLGLGLAITVGFKPARKQG